MKSGRQRGLFPFPLLGRKPVVEEGRVSRSVARRREIRDHVDSWVEDIVTSLNEMFNGNEEQGILATERRLTLSQNLCLDRVREAVLDAGKPPEGISGPEALGELRCRPGYAGDPAHLASVDVAKVSLPPAGSSAASLEKILGGKAEKFSRRLLSKVSAKGEILRRKDECGLSAPYVDPVLKANKRKYAELCRRMDECGIIEYKEEVEENVGIFVVHKKNGKQRLIIDSRLANLHFEKPEKVRLATGSAFGRLEVDGGPPIEVGGVDIADAFYNIALPVELRGLFGLPQVCARDVGVEWIGERKIASGAKIYPVLKVVPMGWTQALWVCQTCHECIVNEMPEISQSLRLVDKVGAPDMAPFVHTEYVDNFVALSQKPGKAFELAEAVGKQLRDRGLPTHEVEGGYGVETLGWQFAEKSPRVQITRKRLWKIRLATMELLKEGKCNGRLLEKLIGHYTFAGLLQRGMLSVFQACYVYVRRHYEEIHELWPEVRRELFWAGSLIALVRKDLDAEWSEVVHATDASFWGRGVVSTTRHREEVKKHGRQCDRWRFSAEEELKVFNEEVMLTSRALDAETLEPDLEHGERSQCNLDSVEEIPLSFIGKGWHKVDSAKWDRVEPIPILEGRSLVWLMQHLARSKKNLGRKHLVLSDSMSATLALAKGRSSKGAMNRICRQIAAIELMSGMQLIVRWIPSEVNPADLPSRSQALESFDVKAAVKKLVENHAGERIRRPGTSWRRSAVHSYEEELTRTSTRTGARRGAGRVANFHDAPERGEGGQEDSIEEEGESRREAEIAWAISRDNGQRCEDILAEENRLNRPGEDLQEGMGRLQAVVPCLRDGVGKPGGLRSCPDQLLERDVLRRRGPIVGGDLAGGGSLLPERCEEGDRPGTGKRGSSRLSQAGTTTRKVANSIPNAVRDCEGPVEGDAWLCPLLSDGVGNMLQTGGGLEDQKARCGGADFYVPSLDRDLELREGIPGISKTRGEQPRSRKSRPRCSKAFEGGRERRGHHNRPALPQELGKGGDGLCTCTSTSRSALRVHHPRCDQGLQCVPEQVCLLPDGDLLHLSAAPWKRIDRRASRPAQPHRHPEERKVANTKVSEKVQQWRKGVSGLRKFDTVSENRSTQCREVDAKDFRSWHLDRGRHRGGFGLEIFSGSGHFSRAIRRKLKSVCAFEVDSCYGPQFDLTKPKIQKEIIKLIKSGVVQYVWLGTPCNSWSRARRNDGRGPGPLRDDTTGLMGLPNLSEKDNSKVAIGNSLMKFSAQVFRLCVLLHIPVALENPHTSRLWLTPQLRHLMTHKYCEWGYTDFCQDGTSWRKRTRILWAHVELRQALKHCAGKNGICSRSHQRHEQLMGSANGQFKTLLAQPYPHRLCQRLASQFAFSVMAKLSAPWWKLFSEGL